jgi:MYXO-CTERM domain-containing protein
MPETEQQDGTLSELVVKEAVGKGLDSPLRDSILEAVDEAEGSRSSGTLPLVGAAFGLGTAVGFLAGRESPDLEEADLEEPEIIEDVMETAEETAETTASDGGSGSRLPPLLLALGVLAGAAFLRRRLASDEEEEWEPIEEFEPATGGEIEADETEADAEGGEEAAGDEETEE